MAATGRLVPQTQANLCQLIRIYNLQSASTNQAGNRTCVKDRNTSIVLRGFFRSFLAIMRNRSYRYRNNSISIEPVSGKVSVLLQKFRKTDGDGGF